jgi:hypothetical protein
MLGFAGLLARLASFSKTQVAAVCVALAAVPVAWQWKVQDSAGKEAARLQTQLEAVRVDRETLDNEVAGLRKNVERLDASLGSATRNTQLAAARAKEFIDWKARIRGLLTSGDYHWPDDSPFVRVSKHVVGQIEVGMPVQPPGTVDPSAKELMGMTRAEREGIESALQNYFSGLDRLIEDHLYETNRPINGTIPSSALAQKIIAMPPLGDAAQNAVVQMFQEIGGILGKDRFALAQVDMDSYGYGTANQVMNLRAAKELQEIVAYINPSDKGDPTVVFQWHGERGMFGSAGVSLAGFLPRAEGEAASFASENLDQQHFPETIKRQLRAWLEQQAQTLIAKDAK